MSARPLKPGEITAIVALYYACGGDIHAHQPIERIKAKFTKDVRQYAKRLLEKTARHPERYVQKHTNKNVTYSITLAGIRLLEDMNIIPRKR